MDEIDNDKDKDDDDDVHAQALLDFERCQHTEADYRAEARQLIRFVNLSEQWPDDVRRQREREGRPCLTVNKTKKMVRQVTNAARQNKPSIKVKPVDYRADNQTADIIGGLIRNIEYISNADAAYDTAIEQAATGGVGYIRVGLEYAYDDVFDLDIKIKRVPDQFAVYGDPDSLCEDSSDWNVAFVTEWVSHEEFERKYGEDKDAIDWKSGNYSQLPAGWADDNRILVAEYWTREPYKREIMQLSNGDVIGADVYNQYAQQFLLSGLKPVASRTVDSHKVIQRILSGAEVLSEVEFPSCYIPIIPVYGNDFVVDGKRYLRGLAYDSMDSQRMYNYWRTVSTEMIALAPKAPWLARAGSLIDQDKWERSGTENYSVLEYRGDLPPQRQPFDPSPMGAVAEAMSADQDISESAGMTGERPDVTDPAQSGAAIWAKKANTDTNTFHFVDNLVRAIRHTGRVIIGLIPHVYNQQRVMRVLGEDGETQQVEVNNGMYDLSVGKYDVVATAGASYASRREEAAYQMSELLRTYPDAAPIVAPLLAKNLDWPEADKVRKQFEAMEAAKQQPPPPPEPTPAEQIFAQIEQAKVQQKQAYDTRKLDIDAYKAETDRASITMAGMTPEQVQAIVMQTINDLINSNNL
jgi:hypothetical protein